jgi:hypothetical protein
MGMVPDVLADIVAILACGDRYSAHLCHSIWTLEIQNRLETDGRHHQTSHCVRLHIVTTTRSGSLINRYTVETQLLPALAAMAMAIQYAINNVTFMAFLYM